MGFDVIVVGARCAGSSTAMLLARRGHRVLLLDRNEFPSDMTASTHMIWHSGVDCLQRWGLLDKLRGTGCPSMKKFNLDMGEFVLSGYAPPAGDADEALAPRRYVLDGLLLEAAREAGVEFRPGCAVTDLLMEGDRVCGVRHTDPDGNAVEERATLVIGADGRNSMVGRLVDSAVRDEHPPHQGTIWAYFSDLPIDEMEFYSRPGRMVYAWQTNDDMTLAGICFPFADFKVAVKNPADSMPAELNEHAPEFARRVREAKREGRWMSGSTRGFIRTASGPGWALVGDAGLTMDPIGAMGISNAFRDADLLAEAVHEGLSGNASLDEALETFEERRDQASLPVYGFSRDMALLEPPPQVMIDLFTALQHSQPDIDAYFGIFAQSVPVQEFFAPENVERIITEGQSAAGKAQPDNG
ncbi:MAG: NAD(P)/FAD-dependent oxidoreductase [Gemmatimonadota bacterium]